nr:hypothetical protein [Tanacetum cinerariifolium]
VRKRARCDEKVPVFTMSQGTRPTGPNRGIKVGPSGSSGPTTRSKKRKNTGSSSDAVIVRLHKKFYNSLGRVPNRCSVENEIVEPDVDVHLFGISMDILFNNIDVTNLVPDDVLEGEDVEVINSNGFDSDPGNDDETNDCKKRMLAGLSKEIRNLKLYKNDSVRKRARCDEKVPVFTMSQGSSSDAVIVRLHKKFYNSLGRVPNRCSVVRQDSRVVIVL